MIFLAVVVVVASGPAYGAAAGGAENIHADDPNIQYVGRFDFSDPKRPTCSWSGSAVRVRFKGPSLAVFLEDFPARGTDGIGAPLANWFEIIVDGEYAKSIVARPGSGGYGVAWNLSDDVHTVEVFKRTEAVVGRTSFLGLQLPHGGKLLPPPARPERKIEFIGDSITAGLDLMKIGRGIFAKAAQNNYLAYGSVAARNLGAEAICIAESGNGVHCNGRGGKQNLMPVVYTRTLRNHPRSKWDFESWKPDVVVIHLGTNDIGAYGMGVCKDDYQKFVDSYIAFVGQVRKNYGDVQIFCAVGPDLWPGGILRRLPATAVETMKKKGDKKIHFVPFDDIGKELHPDAANHRKMADILTKAICEQTGWKPNEVKTEGNK